jgi:hypothetical protein
MIASRKDRKPENDNYGELARYIADSRHDGEKVLMCWSAGCDFENYMAGIREVEATQAKHTRSNLSKTYHLVVSFRPEDEAKLSAGAFTDIEKAFAQALGYEGHQRHCGVHKNTDHLHLHLAFNMVDKEKFRRRTPYYDYYKLSQVCREMEKKYGLSVDRGIEPDSPKKEGQASARVKAIEAQSGQESLFGYIARHKDNILKEIEAAASWSDVHAAFLKRGLLLKPSGNGLTIQDRYGKHRAKPSQIDRGLSKSNLEKRFGGYQPPTAEQLRDIKALETYSAIPLHLGPERDNLHAVFQEELLWRRTVLEEINREGRSLYEANKLKWEQKREQFKHIPMMKRDRDSLFLELKSREQEDLDKIRTNTAEKRNKVRVLIPYTTWNKCLQHKAAQGNEVALSILRSKKQLVQPEIITSRQEISLHNSPEVRKWREQKKEILDAAGISNRNRRALLSVLKMREVFAGESRFPEEPEYRIDGNGTVIFELPGGGTVRDTGREIHYSHYDQSAPDLALKYAKKRWGAALNLSDGIIKRDNDKQYAREEDGTQGKNSLSR